MLLGRSSASCNTLHLHVVVALINSYNSYRSRVYISYIVEDATSLKKKVYLPHFRVHSRRYVDRSCRLNRHTQSRGRVALVRYSSILVVIP